MIWIHKHGTEWLSSDPRQWRPMAMWSLSLKLWWRRAPAERWQFSPQILCFSETVGVQDNLEWNDYHWRRGWIWVWAKSFHTFWSIHSFDEQTTTFRSSVTDANRTVQPNCMQTTVDWDLVQRCLLSWYAQCNPNASLTMNSWVQITGHVHSEARECGCNCDT